MATKKLYAIRGSGPDDRRGKTDRFATLEAATAFIKDYWQGAEYIDGDDGFHTDYRRFELIGFTLNDIGHFVYEDGWRDFRFGPKPPPPPTAEEMRRQREADAAAMCAAIDGTGEVPF